MNKDWLFEEIHMIAQAWKGANGGIYCIRGMCLELLEKLMLPRLVAERERCAAICDGWIAAYGNGNIQYTPPSEYATDAVQDVADAIRSGIDPKSQAKEPEASGGLCAVASPVVRVGEASADLPTTSEIIDVTAGRDRQPHPGSSAATEDARRTLYPAADCQCDPPGGAKCARCHAEARHCIHGVPLTTPCTTCEIDYGEGRACLQPSTANEPQAAREKNNG